MKSYFTFSFPLTKAIADYKMLVTQQLVSRGNGRAPDPPRDIQAQPGSRGALLTWKLPVTGSEWVRGWRIYRDTETNLYSEIQDPGNRKLYVELSSGSAPPVTNFFVSALSAAGAESQKVQVQAQALAETGAPEIPAPPPGYGNEGSGGGGRSYYGPNRMLPL